jgi:hypothetical protein
VNVNVGVRGLPELLRELQRLGEAAQGRVSRNGSMAMARTAARLARDRAPVRTGALKRSIKARRGRGPLLRGQAVSFANASARHAHIIEYGRAGVPARSFLRAAIDEGGAEIRAKLIENLTNGLRRELARQQALEDLGEI